jgi:hypothetical protein
MNQLSKNLILRFITILVLLITYNYTFAQVCPHAKPDLDSTITGIPVLLEIGLNDSVGPTTPTPQISITTAPNHGSITIINGDSVIYTPNAGYNGTDFFFYTVCDTPSGCGCATGQAIVKVLKAPCSGFELVNDSATLLTNTSSLVLFLNNDTAGYRSNFSNVLIIKNPTHGSYSLHYEDSLIYTPNNNFTGADTIIYVAIDSCSNIDTASIYYTINNPLSVNTINNYLNIIKVFPNPANEILNIVLNEIDNNHLKITDIYGKTMYTIENNSKQMVLNIENWNNGTYILQYGNLRKKIIVNH